MGKAKADNRRREVVLEAIVNCYVDSAKPVCSRVISKKMDLSSATIRNVMQDLEEDGYIRQTHTSGGRIPTEKGYRYYVDSLMHLKALTESQIRLIDEEYRFRMKSLEDVLANTSHILSKITNCAGVVILPKTEKSNFQHIDLVPIGKDQVLVILISKAGITKDFIITLDHRLDRGILNKIANFLNGILGRMTLEEVKDYLAEKIRAERDSSYKIIEEARNLMSHIMLSHIGGRLYINGTSHILAQPEFSDSQKIRAILELIEDKDCLFDMLSDDIYDLGTKIHIGRENKMKNLNDMSVITCGYRLMDNVSGRLGVIGPTRMDYMRVIPMVNFLAGALTHALGEIEE